MNGTYYFGLASVSMHAQLALLILLTVSISCLRHLANKRLSSLESRLVYWTSLVVLGADILLLGFNLTNSTLIELLPMTV